MLFFEFQKEGLTPDTPPGSLGGPWPTDKMWYLLNTALSFSVFGPKPASAIVYL